MNIDTSENAPIKKFDMKKVLFLIIFSISSMVLMDAQNLTRYDIPLEVNGAELSNAWVGGLKSPQFSNADLNNDGVDDLFIFDKTGNVILTFVNKGTGGEPKFEYDHNLASKFPRLRDWAMMRDFDNDGAMDIFGQITDSANQGIAVWKGKWEGNKLAFDRVLFPQLTIDAIPISTGNGLFTQIFVSNQDIPGIYDMDDDGDIDILTFSSVGGVIFLYKNLDVENGNSPGTFEFEKVDDCWGRFYESGIVGCLELSDNANDCAIRLVNDEPDDNRSGVHAGSTIAIFDGDADGDKDIILGDISFFNLIYAENEPSNGMAWIVDQDCEYPSGDIPADIVAFPAAYIVDVNNDGKRDMVVSPNTSNNGEDRNPVWYYKNEGTDDAPIFEFQTKQFLLDEMIDVGNGANPTFVDYNADGLLDIVVGNNSYWLTGGLKDSRLQLFLNIGTSTAPKFELTDDDFLGFSDLFMTSANIFNFAPTFGDIDSDGDLDLVIGDNSGRLTFVENTAGPNQTMSFSSPQYNWMTIKVGQLSTPDLVDINRDGLMDIVVGEKTVNFIDYTDTVSSFNLFINTGTASEPMFDPNSLNAPNFAYFGFANTIDVGFNSGESAPAIVDTGDDFLMFSGASSGQLKVYRGIEDNIYGTFEKLYNDYGELQSGWTTRPAVADINDDGILDMLVGNRRGGLQFIKTDFRIDGTSTDVVEITKESAVRIYPNPTSDLINIDILGVNVQLDVQLFNANGQLLLEEKISENSNSIELTNYTAGIYFLKWRDQDGGAGIEKIVVF